MELRKIIKKVIGFEEIYNIGFRRKDGSGEFIFPWDCKNYWYADPLLFEYDSESYVFFEMFDRKEHIGRIGYAKLTDNQISDPQIILKQPFHLSYPNVFNIDNKIFMAPECSEDKSIRFYEAKKFPENWEINTVIETDELYVDGTTLELDGKIFYFTFVLDPSNLFYSKMKVYELFLMDGKIAMEFISEDKNFSNCIRGAGNIFCDGEEIIRPSQLSEAGVYGKAVYLNKVTRTESGFEEQKVREITTETLPIDIKETVLGIHTYSSSSKYEIIDVKYEVFNAKKIYIRIKRYLKKFLKKG